MATTRDGMLCKLDSRGYVLDLDEFAFAAKNPTRQGVDQGQQAGSSSLSNDVVWRRVRENWVGGAGQEYADLEGEDASSPLRFYSSVACDVFDRRKLTVHKPIQTFMVGPVRLVSGTAVKISGGTTMPAIMGRDAANPYTRMVMTVEADWVSATAAPGIILVSADTDTEARWRLRWVYDTTNARGQFFFEMNTAGSGTTYDISLGSEFITGLANGDTAAIGLQVWEEAGDIVVRIYNGEQNWATDDGTLPTMYDLTRGLFNANVSYLSATAKAFPTWSSDEVIHFGKGLTPGSINTFQGTDCVPWQISVSADETFDDDTNDLPHTYADTHVMMASLVDGAGWLASATDFDVTSQQEGSTYRGNDTTVAIAKMTGSSIEQAESISAMPAAVIMNMEGGTAPYLSMITAVGIMRVQLTEVLGSFMPAGKHATHHPEWWVPWSINGSTLEPRPDHVIPYQDGFLFLMSDGTANWDIWRHDGDDISEYLAGNYDMLGAAGSRILTSTDNSLYELTTTPGTTLIYTHPLTSFTWGGAVGAPGAIYAWGTGNQITEIYQLPITDATGAIGAPKPAGSLPLGETVHQMIEHEGVLLFATSKGLRVGLIDSDGSVIMGAVTDVGQDLLSVAASGQYAYAADDVEGMWKFDLSRFTNPDGLTPAYMVLPDAVDHPDWGAAGSLLNASQYPERVAMATAGGYTLPIFSGRDLAYSQNSTWVASADGDIDLGWFTFGIGEELAFDSISVECDEPTSGHTHLVYVYLETPEGGTVKTWNFYAENEPSNVFTGRATTDIRARRFKVRLKLYVDEANVSAPVVRQVVLRVAPAPFISDEMLLPIMLQDSVETEHGQISAQDVWAEWQHLINLRDTRKPVTLNIGSYTKTVRVEGLEVRSGGLGGGSGLVGYDRDDDFLAGRWNVRVVTLD